jgi:ribosomal protein L11 methyltransferase
LPMPKSWIEVRVDIPTSLVEAVSNFLIEQGSPGVIQEASPSRSRKLREDIVAYFPNTRSFGNKKRKIRNYLSSLGDVPGGFFLRQRLIREEKWAEAWKANFKTFHATPHLVIKPPWEDYAGRKGEIVIEIDPGMAFGTGGHPSTRMCLAALEELIPAFPHRPTILDVGTGSGILAIAAQKLGAGKIVALDIDPIAVDSARKNAAANGDERGIDFRVASPGGLRRGFDIVVANLLPQELIVLTPSLAGRTRPGGYLILSGILRMQKTEIHSAFAKRGLSLRDSRELKGWVCLEYRKKRADARG